MSAAGPRGDVGLAVGGDVAQRPQRVDGPAVGEVGAQHSFAHRARDEQLKAFEQLVGASRGDRVLAHAL